MELDPSVSPSHPRRSGARAQSAIARHGRSRSDARRRRFLLFQQRIDRELLCHRVIADNRYTAWFAAGEQSAAELRAFVVQFSVFSNLFLLAQLRKTINADSLQAMRASKEILANELGVTFRPPEHDGAQGPDGDGTSGSVQGGVFRFEAAHFEWLWRTARSLGLEFGMIGKPRLATASTRHFCDELYRLYGAEDYAVSQAASYAIENWAAAGFWKQLIAGFERYNARHDARIPTGFFVWHDRLESQHASHTQNELEDYYLQDDLDEDRFIAHGNEMLDGVAVFWDGLDAQRASLGRKRRLAS